MRTDISTLPTTAVAPPASGVVARADVVVENRILIPGWILTLADYRRWTESNEYPQQGSFAYLHGTVWVDPNMEEFLTHNRVKQAYNLSLGMLLMKTPTGCFVPDRMLLVNEAANLATEPDGLFYLWQTMQSGRLRLVPGKNAGFMQLEGTPDVVLEIVSDSSLTKDLVQLRELYWKAEIPEYWLVDARKDAIQFDILTRTENGYQPTTADAGWVRSNVLAHSFRIERTADPLGLPQFVVSFKP